MVYHGMRFIGVAIAQMGIGRGWAYLQIIFAVLGFMDFVMGSTIISTDFTVTYRTTLDVYIQRGAEKRSSIDVNLVDRCKPCY